MNSGSMMIVCAVMGLWEAMDITKARPTTASKSCKLQLLLAAGGGTTFLRGGCGDGFHIDDS
jgi:hypothetical protein